MNTAHKNILIVDDDEDFIQIEKTILESAGYDVTVARNGDECLEKVGQKKPDLVILDVLMPRQSGIRLYRELKTDKSLKNVKVIMLSGVAKRTFMRSQKALTEFGGDKVPEPEIYIEKPVEPEDLAAAIEKMLS